MIKQNKVNYISWWLDYLVLNNNLINFKYSRLNNIFYLSITNSNLFFYLNKYNLNIYYFYILDMVVCKKNLYTSYQSIFSDLKILISQSFLKMLKSKSYISSGSLWLEREIKEFNNVQVSYLKDSRKLLSNYNYNNKLTYNHFNNLINDLYL